jgi:hypothetical protein
MIFAIGLGAQNNQENNRPILVQVDLQDFLK